MKIENRSSENEDNIIYLKYPGCLSENDINELSDILKGANIQLETNNSAGKVTASFDAFNFFTSLALSSPVVIELIKGIGTNALWDIIKFSITSIRNKVIGEKIYRITSSGQTEKEMTFGVKMKLDKNTTFDFELNGHLSEEIVSESLDKMLDFMREQKPNTQYEHSLYVKFSSDKKKWEGINVLEEM